MPDGPGRGRTIVELPQSYGIFADSGIFCRKSASSPALCFGTTGPGRPRLRHEHLAESKIHVTFAPGKMAEWSIAAVLKTVELQGSGGSNPSLSASEDCAAEHQFCRFFVGVGLGKQFFSPAPTFSLRSAQSSFGKRLCSQIAGVAGRTEFLFPTVIPRVFRASNPFFCPKGLQRQDVSSAVFCWFRSWKTDSRIHADSLLSW